MKRFFAAIAAGCVFCLAASINAQTAGGSGGPPPKFDHSPAAAITFDSGESLNTQSIEGLFQRVAAKTNQAVRVQLQYPIDLAGQSIVIQSMDGAPVIGNSDRLSVGDDGTATMMVRLGASEGIYRFVLRCNDSSAVLRFYAIKPGKPSPDSTLLQPKPAR